MRMVSMPFTAQLTSRGGGMSRSGLHVTRKAERNEVAFLLAVTTTPMSPRIASFSTFPGTPLPP